MANTITKRLSNIVTNEYISNVGKLLRYELDRERSRLSKGVGIISVHDVEKFKRTRTFNIDSDGLPEALEQDRIVVFSVEEDDDNDDNNKQKTKRKKKKIVAKGFISSIELQKIKIILDSEPRVEAHEPDKSPVAAKFEIRSDLAHFDEKAFKLKWAVEDSSIISNLSPHIVNCLLNYYEERSNTKFIKTRVLNLANSPKLSKKQRLAVEQSLMKRISLIEGVEGSGKTLVAATLALSISKIHQVRRKVLLCSPIQATVNRLAKVLSSESGIFVVQSTPDLISDRWDKSYNPKVCLKEQARDEVEYRWTKRIREHLPYPTKEAPYVSAYRIREAEKALIRKADIVCCTLKQSLDDCLHTADFKVLIIDDAQYATEYECLLAMRFKNIKQITLIGDMRRSEQLISHSMRSNKTRSIDRRNKNRYDRRSSFIADSRLRRTMALSLRQDHGTSPADIGSLFNRWLARGLPSVVLKYRHRKIDKLDLFLRQYFYSFESTSLVVNRKLSKDQSKLIDDKFMWPPKYPIMFDVQENSSETILKTLLADIEKWNRQASISLITNHDLDKRQTLQRLGCKLDIDIGCVEDFLGQQRDFVILLCKKTTETRTRRRRRHRLGYDFQKNDEALLIALTRARQCLFIITNLMETMLDDGTGGETKPTEGGWKSLAQYFRDNSLLLQEYPKLNSCKEIQEQSSPVE